MKNSGSRRLSQGLAVAMAFAVTMFGAASKTISQEVESVQALAERIVSEKKVPAVFLAYGTTAEKPLIAAAGVRKLGDPTSVTTDDEVHLGSCTKAITAVLIARLIERGKLTWSDTIESRMPDVAKRLPESHRQVSLEQLLQHRSGFPADARNWWMYKGSTLSEFRIEILVDSLNNLPLKPVGKQELYSNLGYMCAGLIAEHATGEPWEELTRRYVFEPLALKSAGFGPPSTLNSLEQPWGHTPGLNQKHKPMQADNAAALGPAGTVHMSMSDWFRFCGIFAGNCPDGFLTAESRRKLTTPDLNRAYAYGWGAVNRPWAGGVALTHSGSNTMWYCTVWIAPEKKSIYMAALNLGGDAMSATADEAVSKMIQIHQAQTGK